MARVLHIDGSTGEGGGQVLRTSLALSVVTGRPFCMGNIRARRRKPGLMRQHLTAVNAAAQISGAEVAGNALDSLRLEFAPGPAKPGPYKFVTGSAGSATLVLQTVLPPLLMAKQPSFLVMEGGTHNPWAPPFEFLSRSFLPVLGQMGAGIEANLESCGFYPAGGGRFTVDVKPGRGLAPVDLTERGEILGITARACSAKLPEHIARRELATLRDELDLPEDSLHAETRLPSPGPGNVLIVEVACRYVTALFTGFGMKGVSAEEVARRTAEEVREYLDSGAAVDRHLADQLLIPFALAGGGSFLTTRPTSHTLTNIDIVRAFLDVDIRLKQASPRTWRVDVSERKS